MKKVLTAIMSMAFFFSLAVPAFAAEAETTTSITINEYDVYVATRQATAEENARNGVSRDAVDAINSDILENELLRLSKLPNDELNNLGYNEAQIAILRSYTGERIETNPSLRGIFADMNATFTKVSSSTTSQKIKVTWEWESPPALAGYKITDTVGMRWKGTNNAGLPMNVRLDSNNSSGTVEYWRRGNNPELIRSYSVTLHCDDPYGNVDATHSMAITNTDESNYAKKGTMTIKVDKTGTDSINEVAYCFAYGHTIVGAAPSISYPTAFTINFSSGSEKMVEKAVVMNSKGTITEYE